jgi:outer membrane protein assembly factor BamB
LFPDSGAAATAAIVWGQNLVTPFKSGEVALLDPKSGKPAALPFQPQLSPESVPAWTRPAVVADDSALVIGDGRTTLYRVSLKPQPQAHLATAAEQTVAVEIRGTLVAAGDTVYGLTRTDAGEAVVAIDPQALTLGTHWDLAGKPLFALTSVGGLAIVATEQDGLLCLESGQKLRWRVPLAHGPLSGPPVAVAGGELLLLHQGGTLSRINPATGEELAHVDVGEPLGRAACLVGKQVFASASDGGVILVPLPK